MVVLFFFLMLLLLLGVVVVVLVVMAVVVVVMVMVHFLDGPWLREGMDFGQLRVVRPHNIQFNDNGSTTLKPALTFAPCAPATPSNLTLRSSLLFFMLNPQPPPLHLTPIPP